MNGFVSELKSELRMSGHGSFFPPVIIGRSAASLIVQAYISSNPVSAMLLMGDIPVTNAIVPKTFLPTPLDEFNFEPKFPIALLATSTQMERLVDHRLVRAGVQTYTTDDLDGEDAMLKIESWLDMLGI
uniref:Uncharacterized protein n=1 Tax=Mycena chlorophos TaxID=658473 RepID=A0ABQ0LF53_MYCCL|nr:predicted protein [Mycena chlorophos]